MAFEVSKYDKINEVIDEYDANEGALNPDKKIIEYYPRTLTLMIASTFENNVKNKIDSFVYHPKTPVQSKGDYQNLQKSKVSEEAYKKFYTTSKSDRTKISLDASEFYKFFGDTPFEQKIKQEFESLKNTKKSEIEAILNGLSLVSNTKNLEKEYEKLSTINDCLKTDFKGAETAFLELKLKRNRVAHNFLTGSFSDTFEYVVELYYKSMFYVNALESVFEDMTD